jgi:hypothetical protein
VRASRLRPSIACALALHLATIALAARVALVAPATTALQVFTVPAAEPERAAAPRPRAIAAAFAKSARKPERPPASGTVTRPAPDPATASAGRRPAERMAEPERAAAPEPAALPESVAAPEPATVIEPTSAPERTASTEPGPAPERTAGTEPIARAPEYAAESRPATERELPAMSAPPVARAVALLSPSGVDGGAPAAARRGHLVLTSPADGERLGSDLPPVVVVEGQARGLPEPTVTLVANGQRLTARVENGHFRRAVPVLEPELGIRAESGSGEAAVSSATVTVRGPGADAATAVLVLDASGGPLGPGIEVEAVWRPTPSRVDAPRHPFSPNAFALSPGRPEIVYVKSARPGVYTFVLSAREPVAATTLHPVLYLAEGGRTRVHALGPVRLDGAGRVVLGRVLLPQGVSWDQDDWFTGRSEGPDTVTKFRFPEGIAWSERKADLR